MDVDAAVEGFERLAAQPVHQLLARHHPAGVRRERAQHVELVAGQRARLAAEGGPARRGLDLQPAEAHDFPITRTRAAVAACTAEDRADAREELAGVEGLGKVVVGAELQADDPIGVVAPRGEHEYRHPGARADPPAHLEAVQIGQHHVEDDGIGLRARERGEPGRRVVRRLDLHPGRVQVLADHRGEARIVLDHQDPPGSHERTVARRRTGARRRVPWMHGSVPVPLREALDEPLPLLRVEHLGGRDDGVQQPGRRLLRESELRGPDPLQRRAVELRARKLRDQVAPVRPVFGP